MTNDIQTIQNKIYEIRGQLMMLDRDLAELNQVTTDNLNKAAENDVALLSGISKSDIAIGWCRLNE